MMTRKDYDLIARIINEAGMATSETRSLAERFAAELGRQSNPRFDRVRFLRMALP